MKKEKFKPFGQARWQREKLIAQALEISRKDTSTSEWIQGLLANMKRMEGVTCASIQ